MKKINIIWILALIIIPAVIAETQVTPSVVLTNLNTTFRKQMLTLYQSEDMTNINGGEGVAFYIQYQCPSSQNTNVSDWNIQNPDKQIKSINMTFIYSPAKVNPNGIKTYLEQMRYEYILSDQQFPILDKKQFFTIYDGETVVAILDTNYYNGNLTQDSICSFDVYIGTEGCDKCREYDYYTQQQDIHEANIIKTYNDSIKSRIKGFFTIQYELVLILYYAILIAAFIFVVGIALYTLFSLYHYAQHIFK